MFGDDYKKSMNSVKPDKETKSRILENIDDFDSFNQKKKMQKSKIFWRAGTVALACIVAVVGVLWSQKNIEFIKPQDTENIKNPEPNTQSGVSTENKTDSEKDIIDGEYTESRSYGEIYELLNRFRNSANINGSAAGSNGLKGDAKPGDSPEGSIDTDIPTDTSQDKKPNKGSYTETNKQVEGVDEADIVKTDGNCIYALTGNKLRIVSVKDGRLAEISSLSAYKGNGEEWREMYVSGDRLCIISSESDSRKILCTNAIIVDIKNPQNPKIIAECKQNGYYSDSRLAGDKLYMLTEYAVDVSCMRKEKPETYTPCIYNGEIPCPVDEDSIVVYKGEDIRPEYTFVCAYEIGKGSKISSKAILGKNDTVYCSKNNLLTAREHYDADGISTVITRFSIDDGKIEFKADGKIKGILLNQFAMDESDKGFRFVTTERNSVIVEGDLSVPVNPGMNGNSQSASLYTTDFDLKPLGEIKNIAKGESVRSVRFMGDKVYFVTFIRTDPLFTADLSDPNNPKITGELKIPGFSRYLFPFGENKLLGIGKDADVNTGVETFTKLSMFDIKNPKRVKERDKYIIEGCICSSAEFDHKASLVDAERQLIGLDCNILSTDEPQGAFRYRIFKYDGGFKLAADLPLSSGDCMRAVIIGNSIYTVERSGINEYSLDSFNLLNSVQFEY